MKTDKENYFTSCELEKVGDFIKLRMDIGVLSQNEHSPKNDSAINTLDNLMAGLMQYDSDHYEAMDTTLEDALEKSKNK